MTKRTSSFNNRERQTIRIDFNPCKENPNARHGHAYPSRPHQALLETLPVTRLEAVRGNFSFPCSRSWTGVPPLGGRPIGTGSFPGRSCPSLPPHRTMLRYGAVVGSSSADTILVHQFTGYHISRYAHGTFKSLPQTATPERTRPNGENYLSTWAKPPPLDLHYSRVLLTVLTGCEHKEST